LRRRSLNRVSSAIHVTPKPCKIAHLNTELNWAPTDDLLTVDTGLFTIRLLFSGVQGMFVSCWHCLLLWALSMDSIETPCCPCCRQRAFRPKLSDLLPQFCGQETPGNSPASQQWSQAHCIFLTNSEGESPIYLGGTVHFIADTLAEPASPVRALIWPPTVRCRDAQLVPVESILSPVVVELHLEDPALAEASPV
jgi:hypothetical protein